MNVDGFVILAPLLMLPVIALLGFVGCGSVFGLVEVPDPPPRGPSDVVATGRDGYVELSWSAYANASRYTIRRRTDTEAKTVIAFTLPSETSYTDSDNIVNGTVYYYEVNASVGNQEAAAVAEVPATPMAAPGSNVYATINALDTRTMNGISGFGGMAIRVGPAPITVVSLARAYAPNNQRVHRVKIVDADMMMDVPDAFVDIPMTPATPGFFHFVDLPQPGVPLAANTVYYIVSREEAGQDVFYQNGTTLNTQPVAALLGPAANSDSNPTYNAPALPGQCIGPVNFKYL